MSDSLAETRRNRVKESYISKIKNWLPGEQCDVLLACSSSDQGVIRNGGRLGARWAPQALVSQLKKLATHSPELTIASTEVSSQIEETDNFVQAQHLEEERLSQVIFTCKKLIHLGGGHDHILPLMRSLGSKRPLVVLNIDAHCDTRSEVEPHSGNPFRIYSNEAKYPLKLYQFGIHSFANSDSTLSSLSNGEMQILYRSDCDDQNKIDEFILRMTSSAPKDALFIFSLDCDALMASDVSAVSAPNHYGVPLKQVHSLIKTYQSLCKRNGQNEYYGIYELNPLYDSVSGTSSRCIVGLMDEMIGN